MSGTIYRLIDARSKPLTDASSLPSDAAFELPTTDKITEDKMTVKLRGRRKNPRAWIERADRIADVDTDIDTDSIITTTSYHQYYILKFEMFYAGPCIGPVSREFMFM